MAFEHPVVNQSEAKSARRPILIHQSERAYCNSKMGQDEKTAADDKENQDLIASDAAGKQPAAEEHVEITDELDAELEKLLQTPPLEGLTDAQVNERIEKFGRNGLCLLSSLNIHL